MKKLDRIFNDQQLRDHVEYLENELAKRVGFETDLLTGRITKIAKLTQAQYDALAVKDDSTLYVIVPEA